MIPVQKLIKGISLHADNPEYNKPFSGGTYPKTSTPELKRIAEAQRKEYRRSIAPKRSKKETALITTLIIVIIVLIYLIIK